MLQHSKTHDSTCWLEGKENKENKAFSELLWRGTLDDEDEWMLTQLRHCNVRIAAERALLLLYTVSNVHVIARVSLLKDHSVLASETPGVILLLPHSPQANTRAHRVQIIFPLQGTRDLLFVAYYQAIREGKFARAEYWEGVLSEQIRSLKEQLLH